MKKLIIDPKALDILSTDCMHVWKAGDPRNEGISSWLSNLLYEKEDIHNCSKFRVGLTGGVRVVGHISEGTMFITEAKYVPLSGVKKTKVCSFGAAGIGCFLNSETSEDIPETFSLSRVRFPSKEADTFEVSEDDARILYDLAGDNDKGLAYALALHQDAVLYGRIIE
jgi:hypothetical protein